MQRLSRSRSFAMGHDLPSQRSRRAKVFVGGLSRETTDTSLRLYFEEFGAVASAEVLRDHQTMNSRGFGFVTFMSTDVAKSVILKSLTEPYTIDGKQVEVKVAVPKETSKISAYDNKRSSCITAPPYSTPYPLQKSQSLIAKESSFLYEDEESGEFDNLDPFFPKGNVTRSCYTSGGKERSPTSVSTYSSISSYSQNIPRHKQESLVANKIFVGGLLYSTGHESLRHFFEKFGQIVSAEVIYNRDTKKSRGFGFVIFNNPQVLNKIMLIQEYEPFVIDGKQIEVKLCKPKDNTSSSFHNRHVRDKYDELPRSFSGTNFREAEFHNFDYLNSDSKFSSYDKFNGWNFNSHEVNDYESRERYDNFMFSYTLPSIMECDRN